jgi:hypothetical protein
LAQQRSGGDPRVIANAVAAFEAFDLDVGATGAAERKDFGFRSPPSTASRNSDFGPRGQGCQ